MYTFRKLSAVCLCMNHSRSGLVSCLFFLHDQNKFLFWISCFDFVLALCWFDYVQKPKVYQFIPEVPSTLFLICCDYTDKKPNVDLLFLKSYSLTFLKCWCIFVTHAMPKFNYFESFIDLLRCCPESHSVWWPMIPSVFSWRTFPLVQFSCFCFKSLTGWVLRFYVNPSTICPVFAM